MTIAEFQEATKNPGVSDHDIEQFFLEMNLTEENDISKITEALQRRPQVIKKYANLIQSSDR